MLPANANGHLVVDLWRLAAGAYHLAKREPDKQRCLAEAAERLVADAESAVARGLRRYWRRTHSVQPSLSCTDCLGKRIAAGNSSTA